MANDLGGRIAAARTAAGVTSNFVAKEAGIDAGTYSRIESGFIANPTFANIASIARVLKLDLNVLMNDMGPVNNGAESVKQRKDLLGIRDSLHAALERIDEILKTTD